MVQVVYESTVQVKNLILKMLFDKPPTLKRICDCVDVVFADNEDVAAGMIALVLSVGDQGMVMEIQDQINFFEDDIPIGFIDLQTRTLFGG